MNSIRTLIIYYFTGTGNARRAAEWAAQQARNRGLNAQIRRIDDPDTMRNPSPDPDALLGFCGPTHGFNYPPIMVDFFRRFPRGKNPVFLVNTRAGMKLGPLFTPGLGGVALYLAAFILWVKGYKIRGLRPLDLPSNWISLHPGIRAKVVDSIHLHCQKLIERFADDMIEGKRVWRGLWVLPLDMALIPIALGYYLVGRFFLAKTFIATRACNQCGLCEKECPVNAISMVDGRPYWAFRCESCMRCMNHCPQRAIETPHLMAVVFWIGLFVFAPALIYKAVMNNFFPGFVPSPLLEELLSGYLTVPLSFVLLWLSYKLFHYLMRFRLFSALVAYTSFTHYKFWRRYKSPRKFGMPKHPDPAS